MTESDQHRQDGAESARETVNLESFDPRKSGVVPRVRAFAKLGLAGVLVAALVVGVVSVRNYFLISLPVSPPASSISEAPFQDRAQPSTLSGTVDWSFDAGGPIAHAPVVAGDMAYVASGSSGATGRVTALDLDSGQSVWTYRLGSIASGRPVVADDFVYVGMRGGRIVGLDRRTGAERWSFQAEDLAHGSPVVQDGALYFASVNLYALDAQTGELRWRHDPEGSRAISAVAVSQGVAAVLSSGNHLNLIDARKGNRKYTSRLWFAPSGPPTIVGDIAVVSGDGGRVQTFALHAKDVPMWIAARYWWIRLWSWDMAPRPPDTLGYSWFHRGVGGLSARVLSASADKLFLAVREADLSGGLAALDAVSGGLLWHLPTETLVSDVLASVGDGLIVGTEGGLLYGIAQSSGDVIWELPLGSRVSAVAAVDESSVLAATEDGVVQRLR